VAVSQSHAQSSRDVTCAFPKPAAGKSRVALAYQRLGRELPWALRRCIFILPHL